MSDAVPALLLDPKGPTLEIPTPDGEALAYLIEHDEAAAGCGVIVRRLDGVRGPYRVGREPGRLWRCTCESYRYRKGPHAPYGCKHVAAVRPLVQLLDTLFPERTTIPMAPKRKPDAEQPTPTGAPDRAPEAAPSPEGASAAGGPETPREQLIAAVAQALAAPFDVVEVKWKPQTITGSRALMIPFVDARVIQDRLDDVLGVMNWQDSYECLPDGSVVCRLKIRVCGEWITKEDVGGMSEQPDDGDKRKASFSDALKRAAVKFGMGRYLYRQPPQWVDWDAAKRKPLRAPTLPGSQAAPAAARPAEPASLNDHLKVRDAEGARQGWWTAGELRRHVKGQVELEGVTGAAAADVARRAAADFERAARERQQKAG